ncbi:MAG: tetratricopeptide repeat protein [Verrucomicrobiia bacterium]
MGFAVVISIALVYVALEPGRKRLAYYFRLKAYQYQQADDWIHTERMARLSLALVPNDVYTLILLGDSLEVLQRYDEQEQVFRKAVALAPNDVYAFAGLGPALYYLGRDEEAERYEQKAIDLDPSIAQVQTDLAGILLALGRNDEAEEHLREALILDPGLPMAHISLGEVFARRGKMEEAEAEFCGAVLLAPQWWKPHLGLSTFFLYQNRLDEAQMEIQEGLRLQPDAADLVQNLGELYWKRGNLVEAERQYRKGCQLAKDYARAAHQLALFLSEGKGKQQFDEGKFSDLERTLREAIRLWPTFAQPYNNLGYILIADSNRWDEAESLIRRSIDLASAQDPNFFDSLGELLSKQPRRRDEAVAAYRKALAGYTEMGSSNDIHRVQEILDRLETP